MKCTRQRRRRAGRFMIPGILALGLLVGFLGEPLWAQKVLHPDFAVELIYEVPDVEHPSVVTCDDQGNLFVGEDPMDMRGPTTEEFDRILFLQFDEQGEVVRKTVFAENLSAVFGLVWHEDSLYVMHAPHYTLLKDTDGDGVADVRKRLADGFGPPAGIYGFNDHIVTGTRLGMDGLIYVSVGDKGIQKAVGSDGSTITLEGGGVVRMRPDGSQLEIVSSGTRNHLDVAMDSLDNIFTYDNTDDGLGWWTRFTHHVPTGYYGYPYDYHPHPDRHLPHISEHGGGSPVGAACYREAAWPKKYRDAAFHCEWGKRKIQVFYPKRKGATFEATMEDFMVPDGSGEFRPQDLCFSPDGKHMYVADWNFSGWTNPKRVGRLFRVTYVGDDVPPEAPRTTDPDSIAAQITALGHAAHSERMRAQWALARLGESAIGPVSAAVKNPQTPRLAKVHAIWTQNALMDRVDGYDPSRDWIEVLTDNIADVRAQAARALGLRRIKSATGALLKALHDEDAAVRLRAAVALGRIGDPETAKPLFAALDERDEFARFTMIQALRAINHWEPGRKYAISAKTDVAIQAVLAATEVYDEDAVRLLVAALRHSSSSQVQTKAVEALAEVHRKADPYESGWWGTRPAASEPKRPKIHEWAGTEIVLTALREALLHSSPDVRMAAVKAQQKIADPQALGTMRQLAAQDADSTVRQAVMRVQAASKDEGSLPTLVQIAVDAQETPAIRQRAVETLQAIGSNRVVEPLADLVADDRTPAEVLVAGLAALAHLQATDSTKIVLQRLHHAAPSVRSQAVHAAARLLGNDAGEAIIPMLNDKESSVQAAALRALADIGVREAIPTIMQVAQNPAIQTEAYLALAALPDARALSLYLKGLTAKNPEMREACGTALNQLRETITDDLIALHKRNELGSDMRRALGDLFAAPSPIRKWHFVGAWSKEDKSPEFDTSGPANSDEPVTINDRTLSWQVVTTAHDQGRMEPAQHVELTGNCWSMAYTSFESQQAGKLNWMLGSDDQAILWINGEKVYEYLDNRSWSPNQAQGTVELKQGVNHIWLQTGNTGGGWHFSLAAGGPDPQFAFLYDDLPPQLDISAFRNHALATMGNAERGRELFFDPNGVGCVKCHAVGTQGTAKVGPNLLGVGTKYPRHELIRSVLEPSNRIASGYEMTIIVTDDGKVHQGIVPSETPEAVTLVDTEAKRMQIPKSAIVERTKSNLSAMPNGLQKGMSLSDFADIVAFLESLKQSQKAASPSEE